jgi:putative FmdB family regulatory protein
MPIFEYRCDDCGKRSTYLILQGHSSKLSCKHCKGQQLERIMSRFAAPKSEEARMEALADPNNFGGVDENDPKSMARFMKKMSKEMGEDLGEDFDEAMESMGEGGQEEDSLSIPDMD